MKAWKDNNSLEIVSLKEKKHDEYTFYLYNVEFENIGLIEELEITVPLKKCRTIPDIYDKIVDELETQYQDNLVDWELCDEDEEWLEWEYGPATRRILGEDW